MTTRERLVEAVRSLPQRGDEIRDGAPVLRNPIPRGNSPTKLPSVRASQITQKLVPLAKVRSPQATVATQDLLAHVEGRQMLEDLPVVYEHSGLFYVKDGNHRIVVAMLSGRTEMEMRVVLIPASARQVRRRNRRLVGGMRIAIIGWGSLIWQQLGLKIATRWHNDGPLLAIEFARRSRNGRLTLVLLEGVERQQTYWAISSFETLDSAAENLREREGTTHANIHWATHAVLHAQTTSAQVMQSWLSSHDNLDAVIWTGLPPTLTANVVEQAVAYLAGLDEDGKEFQVAHEYVTHAPSQIQTRVRTAMRDRGWNDVRLSEALFKG